MEAFIDLVSQLLAANATSYTLVATVLLGLSVRPHRVSLQPELRLVNVLLAVGSLLHGLLCLYQVWYVYYAGQEAEQFALINRYTGPYWWAALLGWLPLLLAQLFWWRRLRTSRQLTALVLGVLWAGILSPFIIFLFQECLPGVWLMVHLPDYPLLLTLTGYVGGIWFLSRQRAYRQ